MEEIKPMAVYTTEEGADILRVNPGTLRKYIRAGKIRSKKVGRHNRILGRELLLFLDQIEENQAESEGADSQDISKDIENHAGNQEKPRGIEDDDGGYEGRVEFIGHNSWNTCHKVASWAAKLSKHKEAGVMGFMAFERVEDHKRWIDGKKGANS